MNMFFKAHRYEKGTIKYLLNIFSIQYIYIYIWWRTKGLPQVYLARLSVAANAVQQKPHYYSQNQIQSRHPVDASDSHLVVITRNATEEEDVTKRYTDPLYFLGREMFLHRLHITKKTDCI